MLINILLTVGSALFVHWRFRKDFEQGLATAVFLLVLLPTEIRIEVPGPELTVHRAILVAMFVNVYPTIRSGSLASVSKLVSLFLLIGICRIASTFLTALDTMASLKVVFGFLIEIVLYFVIAAAALRTQRAIHVVVWSVVLGLTGIAFIGLVEKYTSRNLAEMIVPDMVSNPIDVTATFRHRILLGYSMAMGFPLALTLQKGAGLLRKWLPLVAVLLLPAVCYFAGSRGPWVGLAGAGAVMAFFGGRRVRRTLIAMAGLTALLLVARPGVFDTVKSLWEQSFSKNTLKGRSADYRKVLWKVVYGELTKSPATMLFGYGGHSTEMLDLSRYFEAGSGGLAENRGHTSWDSQFASNCMQYGYLGFGVEVILYLSILVMALREVRASEGPDRELITACLAGFVIFFWAMATVAIFNQQLWYLFLTLVAIAGRLRYVPADVDFITEATEESTLRSDYAV